jgi:outer membrane protein OmpA-like peptidoglycan-associated protein/opacity protein-like surface antigen
LALVAVLLVAASAAYAGGGEKGDGELGIYGGYGWLDDYGIFHPKNNLLYGARLGYFFTPRWSMEVSAQRLSTETEFDVLGVQNVDVHLDAFRLNALYNFRAGEPVRPFLTAGVGYEKTDIADFGQGCDFGWNAGGGVRWFPSPHWNLRADGRYVRTNVGDAIDKAQSNIEATLGLSVMFGGGKHEPAPAAVVEPVRQNQPPTVSCSSERPEALPGENMGVRAIASDPDGDPLTYEWTTTAGRVTGTDANATLDLTGATPPGSATVTVRVSDGHGHTTSCNSVVAVREPARPAEAISCLAGGFPRNLSRLNNVDKACLDDMAQRLKADPRARVVIVGHADSHERSAEDIGEQRAKAVRDYLVTERSIEASRVTVRSAAATHPLDTGTDMAAQARNRRVDVWFVPEGAKDPD